MHFLLLSTCMYIVISLYFILHLLYTQGIYNGTHLVCDTFVITIAGFLGLSIRHLLVCGGCISLTVLLQIHKLVKFTSKSLTVK